MLLKSKILSYKGTITLTTSDRVALQHIKNEISSLLNEHANISTKFQVISENKKSKYITIFKSPFVYKKAKDTFLFENYSSRIQFTLNNLILLKLIIAKLENYKGSIDSSIKVYALETQLIEKNNSFKLKFGSDNFKKFVNF